MNIINVTKSKYSFRMLITLSIVSILLVSCESLFDTSEEAIITETPLRYRVINNYFDSPLVNVSVDNSEPFPISYHETSNYIEEGGTHQFKINLPNGKTISMADSSVFQIKKRSSYTSGADETGFFSLEVGGRPLLNSTSYTMLIAPKLSNARVLLKDTCRIILLPDNPAPAIKGRIQFRFVNLVPDMFKASLRSQTMKETESYKADFGVVTTGTNAFNIEKYVTLVSGSQSFLINESIYFEPANLPGGKTYTVVCTGTLNAADAFPLQLVFYEEGGNGKIIVNQGISNDENPYLRFIHTANTLTDIVPGVYYGLDLKMNDDVLFQKVKFSESSGILDEATVSFFPYKSLQEGTYNFQLVPNNTVPFLIQSDFKLERSRYYTVYVVPAVGLEKEKLMILEDEHDSQGDNFKIRIVNLIPDLTDIEFRKETVDGDKLSDDVAFGTASPFISNTESITNVVVVRKSDSQLLYNIDLSSGFNTLGSVSTLVLTGTVDIEDTQELKAILFLDTDANYQLSGSSFPLFPFMF